MEARVISDKRPDTPVMTQGKVVLGALYLQPRSPNLVGQLPDSLIETRGYITALHRLDSDQFVKVTHQARRPPNQLVIIYTNTLGVLDRRTEDHQARKTKI